MALLSPNYVLRIVGVIFLVAIFITIIVIGAYFYSFHGPLSNQQGIWGEFGDFVGGALNPIISLFALSALLITIVLQSKELQATREQLVRSVELAEDTAKRQLRAYVFNKSCSIALSPTGGFVGIDTVIENTGQTPAFELTTVYSIFVDTYPPTVELVAEKPTHISKTALGPGLRIQKFLRHPLVDSDWAMIRTRDKTLYVVGGITYRDTFGIARTSNFTCIAGKPVGIGPNGEMAYHEEGNDAT